jgi:hypothetical protein
MGQPFDTESARTASKRGAEPNSSFGSESKRSCFSPSNGCLDLNSLQGQLWTDDGPMPDTNYVVPPAGASSGRGSELASPSELFSNGVTKAMAIAPSSQSAIEQEQPGDSQSDCNISEVDASDYDTCFGVISFGRHFSLAEIN